MAKSVCVVGAGPAGLVAAKTLVHGHPRDTFAVTIFEQSDRIGGLWPSSTNDVGMVNPNMSTNISKYAVSFSDLAWPDSSSFLPKAWQVGQYLKRYMETYGQHDIRTSCKVLRATRSPDISSTTKRWKIKVQTRGEKVEYHDFDYLLLSSGFFGEPKFPEDLKGFDRPFVPVKHSTQFREVTGLLQSDSNTIAKPSKIVVVGGSLSGAETAASVALQLSSDANSPGTSQVTDSAKYRVYHIISRPCRVIPYFLAVSPTILSEEENTKSVNPAPTFLPIDLASFDLKNRPSGPLINKSGRVNPQAFKEAKTFYKSLIGDNQRDIDTLAPENSEISDDRDDGNTLEAPWTAMSDSYTAFVRSGHIIPIGGTLTELAPDGASNTLMLSSNGVDEKLEDVAALILATGFDNLNSLSYLPDDVLQILDYNPEFTQFPLLLNMHSTVHKQIPDLGFVGFYRGPYWGVMEMQARFLGRLWSGDEQASRTLNEDISPITELRTLYTENPAELAQFPMGDYAYIMESFKSVLNLERIGDRLTGAVIPARYLDSSAGALSRQESAKAIFALVKTLDESAHKAKFVSRAIFTSLQGNWKIDRSITSFISTYPSGRFVGTAQFMPRFPTEEGYDTEYLYVEEGNFETETGMNFRANRRYAYRYTETTDTLSAWFVKADNKSVDYLFHNLEILPPTHGSGWRARAHHLCIQDTYDVVYEFRFRGVHVQEWTMEYTVRGPSKDYRIASMYRR